MRVYVGGGRVFVFPSGLFLFEGSVRRILPVFLIFFWIFQNNNQLFFYSINSVIFVSVSGFRIGHHWFRIKMGTPVKIRDYPRSCKFHLPIYSGEKIVAFLSHWSCKDREGATTETSQKTCRHPQTFRLSGEKAIERILQDSFYYSIFSHARMFAQLNKKE